MENNMAERILNSTPYKNGTEFTLADMMTFLKIYKNKGARVYVNASLNRLARDGKIKIRVSDAGKYFYKAHKRIELKMRKRTNEQIGVTWPVRSATLPGWR